MLSALILTKNEEKFIGNCINSLKGLADEIIVIDNISHDRTVEIATQKGAQVYLSEEFSFAKRRDLASQQSHGDWLLYVDADERVTSDLSDEIKSIVSESSTPQTGAPVAYIINRKDFYFGKPRPVFSPMHRLMKREALIGWFGDIHETPKIEGTIGTLASYFLHFTHTDLNTMLLNTLRWSEKEAQLRFQQNHPPIVWWRLLRVCATGFWNSFVTQKGYKCGTAGWVEAIYQGFSLFITYAKLWELQNKQRIESDYQNLDSPYTQ
jgi:(heptosyl)LPS beta-1,4-glucosyltransferase